MHPLLYQINTRVVLTERGRELGRPATLDDITDEYLAGIRTLGFDWIWWMGIWQTGEIGRRIALEHPDLQAEYRRTLADFEPEDVAGSPYAVAHYYVHRDFGGNAALLRLRERMRQLGLKLMLDFVPNHVAPDHAWVRLHPEYFVHGTEQLLATSPENYVRCQTDLGPRILAYGRDPNYSGWTDTRQLNYRHHGFRTAAIAELQRIATQCDGVRCDMAMLLLPDVFQRTWGDTALPADGTAPDDNSFWPLAISKVRETFPEFVLMAEVYWDREWDLQQLGFDFTYDKRLYDRLAAGNAAGVHDHLLADGEFQRKSVRFLENHDEPRAAAKWPFAQYKAASLVSWMIPGMRFLHEGQLTGRRIKLPVQLRRRPTEAIDLQLQQWFMEILALLRDELPRRGRWQLLECSPAFDGNSEWRRFIVSLWTLGDRRWLVVVNLSAGPGRCYVRIPPECLTAETVRFEDRLSSVVYDRSRADLMQRGIYFDLPEWGVHLFEFTGLA